MGLQVVMERSLSKECPICQYITGAKAAFKFYEDSEIMIVMCEECKIPMVIFKQHQKQRSVRLALRAEEICKELWGESLLYFNTYPVHSDRHTHWHVVLHTAKQKGAGRKSNPGTPRLLSPPSEKISARPL